ncbi:MAG: HPr family phosphocarrier protein [Eubacteriales bacterium]|nr:HPr family phosphocarrier protein [Eubacteriales bacterium]MDD4474812.1 HPr family phosphocarrier protein [Eubacteriales bacterium]
MEKFSIRLKQIADVQEFAKIATAMPYSIDLHSGRYIVDGKSIMGIFSLDLAQKIEIVAHTDDASELKSALSKFLAE